MFPLKCITAVGVTGARYARGFGFVLTFNGRKLYLGEECGRLCVFLTIYFRDTNILFGTVVCLVLLLFSSGSVSK